MGTTTSAARRVRLSGDPHRAVWAVLELRVRVVKGSDRGQLHSQLLVRLARNFAQSGLHPEGAESAPFS